MNKQYHQLLIDHRRHFHQYPEIGWSEFKTTADIVRCLRALHIPVLLADDVINREFIRGREQAIVDQGLQFAKDQGVDQSILNEMDGLTGCVALFDSGRSGPTVALRFDIDCVNVSETEAIDHHPNQLNFASKCPGLMHACGHDGHIALGLTLAQWLHDNLDQLNGKIKILFQPAEEGVRGAIAMAQSGILDDVDYFLSSHIGFIANSGEIIVNPTHFLCTTKLDVRYQGKASHAGAEPHKGKNALAAACHASIQMLAIPRHGEGSSRINIGQIVAGEGRNVTPSHAEIKLEVRGETAAINQYMVDQVMNIVKGCACSFDVSFETEIMGEAVDLINDDALIDIVRTVASETEKVTSVVDQRIFGGSEDATILAKRVQQQGGKSIYFIIGTDRTAGHHQAAFDLQEDDLLIGFNLFSGIIHKLCS